MSFRLFIYYCALCGGIGAFMGWGAGRWELHRRLEKAAQVEGTQITDVLDKLGDSEKVLNAGLKGFFLGLGIALLLSILDVIWNYSTSRVFSILARVLVAMLIGGAGGLLGGIAGQWFIIKWDYKSFLVVGWTLTGFLIGASVGVFDLLSALLRNQETRGPLRKTRNGLIGGTVGGILGGVCYVYLKEYGPSLFSSQLESERLWSPSAWGFVILGMCIGLLIGLTQVILKEAWVKVEEGFRKGRELILAQDVVTIGRAESCDIGLFGDMQVEKLHCRIVHKGNDYILMDDGTPAGTYVNDERVHGSRTLHSGDRIRLGRNVLRFGERARK